MNCNIKYISGNNHIPWLDGIRGFAALWVFLSHAQILSGMNAIPILSKGGIAVDLFMMLSGFLMTHHYFLREKNEPWEKPCTIFLFWTRRFFRIAPLYYFLLVAAIAFGPMIGKERLQIAAIWPKTMTNIIRFTDQGFTNILMHFSFTFGLVPSYAFRTPLPDWSIGLEMQFYAAFPFIILLMRKINPLWAILVLGFLCLLLKFFNSGFFAAFEMPAFLPFKINIFMFGMLIAWHRFNRMSKWLPFVALLISLSQFTHGNIADFIYQFFIGISLFYLMNEESHPITSISYKFKSVIRSFFSSKIAVFLGTISYSTYLVHLLIITPIVGTLSQIHSYQTMNQYARFLVIVIIAMPIVYLLSWCLFMLIEIPGIRIGKFLIDYFNINQKIPSENNHKKHKENILFSDKQM